MSGVLWDHYASNGKGGIEPKPRMCMEDGEGNRNVWYRCDDPAVPGLNVVSANGKLPDWGWCFHHAIMALNYEDRELIYKTTTRGAAHPEIETTFHAFGPWGLSTLDNLV